MTLLKLTIKYDSPTAIAFIGLRALIGWGKSDVAMVEASLANSLFHVTIYHDNKLIGMGRVVGDGVMYFYVQDVVVDPEYQKQGVGNSLMQEIEKYLARTATSGATIGLLAAKGKEGFYRQFGYQKRPSERLGNGMCKFIT